MSENTTSAAKSAGEVATVAQAAKLAGRDEKTIRRCLPTPGNKAKGQVRLPGAYQDGTSPNAPWFIPVSDLEAAGFCTQAPSAGSGSASDALARQRDERELVRLRDELAAYRADNVAKAQLLADRDAQIRELNKQLALMHTLAQTLAGRAA
ncbi:hypothetical protein [Pedococcus soli]